LEEENRRKQIEEEDLFAALMAGVAVMKVKFCGGEKSTV
jgi:hypothetical protein